MLLTTTEIRRALEEIRAFADERPTDIAAVTSQIDRCTNLVAAVEEAEGQGAERDTSTYGLLGAGIINERLRLRNRLAVLEAGDA